MDIMVDGVLIGRIYPERGNSHMKGTLTKINGKWWLVNRTGGMSLEKFFPNMNNWPDTSKGAKAEFSRLPAPTLTITNSRELLDDYQYW